MIGAPQQNWRQIMQMPQQWNAPSGLGFPTQSATGGWMMPGPTPFVPQSLAKPTSAASQSSAQPNPGESQFDFLSRMSLVDPANYASKVYEYQTRNPNWRTMGTPGAIPGAGYGYGTSPGYSPGFDANSMGFWGGLGMGNSAGWGGLFGSDAANVGMDAGTAGGPGAAGIGGADVGGFGWY